MTNEELVALIQAGDRDKLLDLWEQVRAFVVRQAYRRIRALDDRGAVTPEDLIQAGFIGMIQAVGYHDACSEYKFLTVLNHCLKTAFAEATNFRTEKRRRDPINDYISLYTPLTDEEDGEVLGDVISDPQAQERFEGVEARQMQEAVETALQSLTEDQRTVIRLRYWYGLTYAQAASVMGITEKEAGKLERKALQVLRHPTISKELWKYV